MNIVAAVFSDWGIGLGGTQQIVIPEDRDRFRKLTDGGVVIVGRKTFEILPGPLLNRRNIVLTRDPGFFVGGVVVSRSVDAVLSEIEGVDPDKVFVIGGAETYRAFLPLCTRAYVTKIDMAPPSDAFFPDLDALPGWELERRSGTMEYYGIRYSLYVYLHSSKCS